MLDRYNGFEGHNTIGSHTEIASSDIGLGTYVADGSVIRKAKIGRFCSIGSGVQTGLGVHPSSGFVSTHPAFYSIEKQAGFTFTAQNLFNDHVFVDDQKKHVVQIGNDVWIGNNVMIMDGVTIGDGSIIASGAIVNKDVAPFTIVGGVPAKFIKLRFSEQQIKQLLHIKWWAWSFDKIKANSMLFDDIERFLENSNLQQIK
ncbi:CatB-related O-acetyltransferase [Mucilaginibacter sp. ZB1P21]|uniref:CatB-related O-acetyltransferase n=2 Tax=Mucilaginibacter glaciei TaxID=2772109 RepID=A0A926NP36_9SPHI|nr:CatB-related O-acetyltransferase [Mucilaginibacter glaciei]